MNASCQLFLITGFLTAGLEQLNEQIEQFSVQATETMSCPHAPFHSLSHFTFEPVVCFVLSDFSLLGTFPLTIFSCDFIKVHLEGLHSLLSDRVPGFAFLAPLHVTGTA